MNKLLLTAIFLGLALRVDAQKEFHFGPTYTAGVSTIVQSGMDHMNGSMSAGNNGMNSDLSFKSSFGTGLRLEYYPVWKWGIYFQCGYQQRGAIYSSYPDEYYPRYKFNQCDFNLGGQFRTKGLIKNHQLLMQLGVTQHYLSSASREYDTGGDNIIDETRRYDVGAFLGLGVNIPIKAKDMFQVLLFANQGFVNPFMGSFETNGISGTNLLFGVQLNYLIGKTFAVNK